MSEQGVESVHAVRTRRSTQLKHESPSKVARLDGSTASGTYGGKQSKDGLPVKGGCEKVCCTTIEPVCFAAVSEKCASKGQNVRWFHVSTGEHYCFGCHHYYSKREEFQRWKATWIHQTKAEPSMRLYMAEEVMPWWLKCRKCDKWRQLSSQTCIMPSFIDEFSCDSLPSSSPKKSRSDPCSKAEDKRASWATDPKWIESLALPSLIKYSPARRYISDYFWEGVGMSPTASESDSLDDERAKVREYLQPFHTPEDQGRALCIRPDVMEYDELLEFSEYAREQVMYLGLRNLVVALWNLNPCEWLTVTKCARYILCRGLVRIRCIYETERILGFLSRKGVVNCGILPPPVVILPLPGCPIKQKIVVIGAGISGLGAARQLKNFGCDVVVIEARNRIGGRIWDSSQLGAVVGLGAHLVTGLINNPVSLMCVQASIPVHELNEECRLLDDTGEMVDVTVDKRVDFHFNALLDAGNEWRKDNDKRCPMSDKDRPLGEKLQEMNLAFINQTGMKLSAAEERLLNFHKSNLEYSCGAPLDEVSALHWDQNEQFSQFTGAHALMIHGYHRLVELLAEDLDVRLEQEATDIICDSNQVEVKTPDGCYVADKVLVTIPLAVLQTCRLQFYPPLPEEKENCIQRLGAGLIEKVAVKFPTRFWSKKIKEADYFGHVPFSDETRGCFSIFYDLSDKKNDSTNVLMSYLSGPAAREASEKTDDELITMFIDTLKRLFPDETVPEPLDYVMSRWSGDQFASMSYSFVKLGATGTDYDTLSEDVQQKIFFAGEATNRHFPQTVAGAYLSGLREAGKIISPPDISDL